MSNAFCRYVLRTTDTDGAVEFYAGLLGPRFLGDGIEVEPLPRSAAARGAPPHWLGALGVDDVVGAALRFAECGATLLGPLPGPGESRADVVLRDPSGAIVALTPARSAGAGGRVVWHLLSTRDETRAFEVYARLFGWTSVEDVDLGGPGGRHVMFSCDGTTRCVGSVADIARLPHVHPQWLFFFRTENLRQALERVRDLGGLTLPIATTHEGNLVAPCDDPQGAAFALYEVTAR